MFGFVSLGLNNVRAMAACRERVTCWIKFRLSLDIVTLSYSHDAAGVNTYLLGLHTASNFPQLYAALCDQRLAPSS
jgi:hypothetical protein